MRRRTSPEPRSGRLSLLAVTALLLPLRARAEPDEVRVALGCRPEAAPGRVLCELNFKALPGARLAWADALVIATPEFAKPLRSRVTPERSLDANATERKVGLAFVASQNGVGQVVVRARAVVCRGQGQAERCRPVTQEARAEIRVGS